MDIRLGALQFGLTNLMKALLKGRNMDNLVLTIILSLILMLLVIAGLAIGLILTGKSRLKRGCGLTPGRKRRDDSTCQICGKKEICEKEEEEDDASK